MKITWHVTATDANRVRTFVEAARSDALVRARLGVSGANHRRALTRAAFWHALTGSLLTTQQKSGPGRPVTRFLLQRPFPLSYAACCSARQPAAFVTRTLSTYGGIRRSTRIGEELAANLRRLNGGLWVDVLDRVNSLLPHATQAQEFDVAEYLDDTLMGLGPKQSRNLLMAMGITRYEIPIDSRAVKWLNDFGFPIRLSAAGLTDRHYYAFVSRGIQQLCAAADVLPSVFDAAVFASFDKGGWTAKDATFWGHDGA